MKISYLCLQNCQAGAMVPDGGAPAPFWESRIKIHFLGRFWQTVNLLRHNVKLPSDS
jgi:hypothetical protein